VELEWNRTGRRALDAEDGNRGVGRHRTQVNGKKNAQTIRMCGTKGVDTADNEDVQSAQAGCTLSRRAPYESGANVFFADVNPLESTHNP